MSRATAASNAALVLACASTRPPARKPIRTWPRIFSTPRSSTLPTSLVRDRCVPPHALRSRSAMVITRMSPVRPDGLRRPVRSANVASSKPIDTSRASPTISFAQCSSARSCSVGRGGRRELDAGVIRTKVHAHRVPAEAIGGQRRHEVLGGVLFRVIATTESIHGSVNRTERYRGIHHVNNATILVDHVGDLRPAEDAGVVRLSAGCRVERGSIEHQVSSITCVLDRDRVELEQAVSRDSRDDPSFQHDRITDVQRHRCRGARCSGRRWRRHREWCGTSQASATAPGAHPARRFVDRSWSPHNARMA